MPFFSVVEFYLHHVVVSKKSFSFHIKLKLVLKMTKEADIRENIMHKIFGKS